MKKSELRKIINEELLKEGSFGMTLKGIKTVKDVRIAYKKIEGMAGKGIGSQVELAINKLLFDVTPGQLEKELRPGKAQHPLHGTIHLEYNPKTKELEVWIKT